MHLTSPAPEASDPDLWLGTVQTRSHNTSSQGLLLSPCQGRGERGKGGQCITSVQVHPGGPRSITDCLRIHQPAPLTTEEQLLQPLQQLCTLTQLLLETCSHTVIHITGQQQLCKCRNHGVHVLTVNDTEAMAILNLLPVKGELPGLGLNQ